MVDDLGRRRRAALGSASASRAAIAASQAGGVRGRGVRLARGAAARRGGPAVSSSKRASASASRSASNNSMRVSRPSAPKTQSQRKCRSKAPPPARSVPKFVTPHEQRVGSQAEDVVDANGDVVGDLEQGAEACAGRLRAPRADPIPRVRWSTTRWRARAPWRSDRGRTVPSMRRDRARRRRGAGARGAVGEELGVALVQPRDGVAQLVGGEDLGPPASPLRVDLDQDDLLALVGADIEPRCRRTRSPTSTGGTARASRRGWRAARAGTSGLERSAGSATRRAIPCRSYVGAGGMVARSRRGRRAGWGARRRRGQRSRRRCGRRSRSRRSARTRAPRVARRRLGRQLVEAGERLGVAVGVEQLEARHEAIGSEDPEQEERAARRRRRRRGRCRSSSGARGARRARRPRIVVDRDGDVVGDEQEPAAYALRAPLPLHAQTRVPKVRWSTDSMAGANAAA